MLAEVDLSRMSAPMVADHSVRSLGSAGPTSSPVHVASFVSATSSPRRSSGQLEVLMSEGHRLSWRVPSDSPVWFSPLNHRSGNVASPRSQWYQPVPWQFATLDIAGHVGHVGEPRAMHPSPPVSGLMARTGDDVDSNEDDDDLDDSDAGSSSDADMREYDVDGNFSWCASCATWLQWRIGKPAQFALVVACMLFTAADVELSEQAFRNTQANVSSVLVVYNLSSFVLAVVVSFCIEGRRAPKHIFSWGHAWRFTGIAWLFTFSTFLVLRALQDGSSSSMVATLGYLYLPISALLSTWFFGKHSRRYGCLEWLALVIMTLSAFCYIILRERSGFEQVPDEAEIGDPELNGLFEGMLGDMVTRRGTHDEDHTFQRPFLLLLAIITSATGSILAERIYKGRSLGILRRGEATHIFAVQKVHLDFASLIIATIIWVVETGGVNAVRHQVEEHFSFASTHWFGEWQMLHVVTLIMQIGQGWTAGLVCKQFSTVVKSMIQTLATIVVLCISDPILGLHDFRKRALPSVSLALVLVLAAVIFQTGRINLKIMRRTSLRNAKAAGTLGPDRPDEASNGVGPDVASVRSGGASTPASLAKSMRSTISEKVRKRSKLRWKKITGYAFMLIYVAVFVLQQLFMQQVLSQFPIVSSTMNLMTFISGVTLASTMTVLSYGWPGLRHAWSGWQILRFLPIGVLFGLSQSMIFMAYAHHVTASIVMVLGFIYLPVAAILKRSLLNSYTMWLQWVALVIITIASMNFGEMQAKGNIATSVIGMWFVIISAILSAIASIVMEKTLKMFPGKCAFLKEGASEPFYVQKVALDMGSVFVSLLMFFVQGWLSERPMDAFWRDRPLGRHCADPDCWGRVGDLEHTCGSAACSCACDHGVFVNWDSPLVWLTLVIITARTWLKGEVTKAMSTLEVAIAEAFAPVLIYFVGQPITMRLQGVPTGVVLRSLNDWALNCIVLIIPLSAAVYTLAESKMRKVMESIAPDRQITPQCCPLDTLLVILRKLETRDDFDRESTDATPERDDSDISSMDGTDNPEGNSDDRARTAPSDSDQSDA